MVTKRFSKGRSVIDQKRGILFIHIPKTGGTSFVQSVYGDVTLRIHAPFRAYQRGMGEAIVRDPWRTVSNPETWAICRKRLRLALESRFISVDTDRYRSFALVRNPWARALSWFRNVIRDPYHLRVNRVDGDIDFSRFVALY